MKRHMITALKLIMVSLLFGLVLIHKSQTPRILIIHSYHVDYAWVRDANIGLKRVFDKHYDITSRYHYMNLKKHQDQGFMRRAETAAHKLIQSWQPDVIILFDDLAQKLVGTKVLKQNHSIQIVFAGVNDTPAAYGYNADDVKNVAGILEIKPLDALKDILEKIAMTKGFDLDTQGPKPKIVFLGTKSASITAEIKSYKDKVWWEPLDWLDPVQVDTYGKWIDQVRALKDRADILLVANYRRLEVKPGDEELAKPRNIMRETQKIFEKPVVGMNYFNVEDGAALAVGPSPYEQGNVAAKMAIRIAKEKKQGSEIGIVKSKQFIIAIRKEALENWKIELPPIYEAFARATDNYWEEGQQTIDTNQRKN